MKIICVLKSNPFFENTASSNRIRSLLDGLANLDVEVEILVSNGFNSIDEIKYLTKKCNINGIQITYLGFLYFGNLWARRLNSYVLNKLIGPFIKFRITKIVKRDPTALFWVTTDLFLLKLFVSLKNEHKDLILFTEMSEFLDIHLFTKANSKIVFDANSRKEYIENTLLHKLNGLALMTKTLINHYNNFQLKRLNLLHLPMTVDLERFIDSKDVLHNFKSPYIAFVGVMDDKKDGVSILIEAFNKIKDQYPSHSVYLVGGWNYDTPHHLKLINEYNLTDRVHWMKEYPRDSIPNIICNAELLVLPRPDSKQAQGGFPTKLGEYLASGVPVCATTVGEIPDYLVDNESVFFAEPGSVESFAAAMNRALSDPANAKRIGLNGRKVAEAEFNKDIQAKKLYDFLKTL